MRVLFLGKPDSPLLAYLRSQGDDVVQTMEPVSGEALRPAGFGFLVSYGYRHILRADVLDLFPGRAVNLHASFLPWNRGADPNLWSFLEGTPKGVSLHHLDLGVDTGDIIAQRETVFGPSETLRTSYDRLQADIQALFRETWPALRAGALPRSPQPPGGTLHRMKDKAPHEAALRLGHDTPVSEIEDYGRRAGLTRAR